MEVHVFFFNLSAFVGKRRTSAFSRFSSFFVFFFILVVIFEFFIFFSVHHISAGLYIVYEP